jgi:hypothetical protein
LYNEYTSKFYHAVFRPLLFASSHQSNPVYGLMSFFDSFSFYFSNLLSQNFLLIFFFIAIFFFIFNHDYKNFKITSVFIIFSVYWLYFTSIVNKQPRFVLVFVPYLAILSAYGFISLINFLKKQPFLVHIPSFLFLSFIFLFSVFGFFGHVGSLNVIDEQFGWRVNEEFPIVSEYYSLFNFSSSLPILTTDPLPVVYSDNLFIPFYFSVDEGISIYVTNRLRAKTVIFSDSSFICYNQDCNDKLDNLFFDINNRFDKSFEKKFGDRTYYIFSRKG